MNEPVSSVLYLSVCAAPPAQHTTEVLSHLQAAGWDVCVIATPQASLWMDVQALAKRSGHVVRTNYKLPWEADPLPRADAMLVMPATFNTINKWAQGIGDTLATGLLCEALGRGTPPIVAVPCLKMDLVRAIQSSRRIWPCCANAASASFTNQNATSHRSWFPWARSLMPSVR